jgi:hypothetical protein
MTDTPLSDDVLLPCDWCGKPPSIVCPDNSYGMAYITCGDANECPVEVIVWAELPHETLEDAKRRWNTRAALEAAMYGEMVACLCEAMLQLEYLDGKFQPTGTTAAVLTRTRALLSSIGGV